MDVLSQEKSKPLSTLFVFSFIPPRRSGPKEEPVRHQKCIYMTIYQRAEGYHNKLHRDDREHAKSRGLDIFNELCCRPLSMGVVCPQPCTHQDDSLVVYRKNGITRTVEEGYGTVVPV
uniref:Uncharacterized protein n=1 Tax=Electrophorus electricus TaxID=8005 RepID=A0A4W4GRG8_ELEEL